MYAFEIIKNRNFEKMKQINIEISQDIDKAIDSFSKIRSFCKNSLYFYEINSRFDIALAVSTILSVKNVGKTIIVFLRDSFDKNKVKISSRNEGNPIIYSIRELMDFGTKGLSDATSGGHIPAAGGIILKKDIKLFKERVIAFVKRKLHNVY
jgi:nanoRNase/pAp phosphatase (c-di-AMP/oligoRNAs hydrolase)